MNCTVKFGISSVTSASAVFHKVGLLTWAHIFINLNKHTERIAKAIQVPNRPQQIQICIHYFHSLISSPEKSGKQILKGNNSWKSRSTVTEVELDL